jgi:pilus assembly protein Flp/PilA
MMLRIWLVTQSRCQAMMAALRDREDGQTLVEYALLLVLIAIVVIAMVTLVGTNLNLVYNRVANNLSNLTG